MNKSINLVSNRNEQLERELLILKIVRVVAVSLLITISIVAIGAFIFSAQISISKIKEEENATLSQISALHDRLTTYYLIKDRVRNIASIISTRRDYSKHIDAILAKTPSTLSLEGINIEKDIISVSMSGNSLVSINKFIDDMSELGKEKKILNNVKLESLSLNVKSGEYTVIVKGEAL
ncbi:MAG: hypothetical protein AAB532_03210 [Patescibacteria group bacterium]